MSDLISRSELIMRLSDYALQESPNDNESTGEQRISKMIYDAIQNCISCVEEQPTAYSVDKVVEELEANYSVKLYGSGNSDNYLIPVKRAIEIVKQGGVSDDVCELRYCHHDDTDEYHDCLDYMECEECPYYYADLD